MLVSCVRQLSNYLHLKVLKRMEMKVFCICKIFCFTSAKTNIQKETKGLSFNLLLQHR